MHFREGSNKAVASLEKLRAFTENIDGDFIAIHKEAIQQLAEDAASKLASALEGVRRKARSLITAAQKQAVVKKLIDSQLSGRSNPSQQVKEVLEKQGLTAIQGTTRKWNLEDYAFMLTETVLAEAHNSGAMTRYLSNSVEYAEVIEQGEAKDKTCQTMRGKAVWLRDRRMIPPYHPHCRGGIKPLLEKPDNPTVSPEDPRIPAEVRSMLLKRA